MKTWITESKTIASHGDVTKLFSVYAQGRSDNYVMSSVGAKINVGRFTLNQSLGIENLGISHEYAGGDRV